jgi:two-component system cell cycle response regulator DivK
MNSRSILVVDDNESNLRLMEALLETEGYVVKTALEAKEAMLVLETFEPQLILMDLQLPGMNGLEFTRLLKQDPARRHISIVALTAYAMKGDEEKAIAAGCNGYLTKPIDTRSLPKSIAAYMNNSRDFEEAAAGKRAANET